MLFVFIQQMMNWQPCIQHDLTMILMSILGGHYINFQIQFRLNQCAMVISKLPDYDESVGSGLKRAYSTLSSHIMLEI
jgi:hypothetical protein